MSKDSEEMDQCSCMIEAMVRKELSAYQVPDYLAKLPASEYGAFPIDPEARRRIVDWYLKIVQLLEIRLDVAGVAVSILDRFAASPNSKDFLIHREKFQLASLAAIYTAIKIHAKEAISPAFVAKLSGGKSTKEDVERMEFRILQTLQWRVNPPTAMWFAESYLRLLNLESKHLTSCIESQVTHAMLRYKFCTVRPSEIAAAAVLNALEAIFGRDIFGRKTESLLLSTIQTHSAQLKRLRSHLSYAISYKVSVAPSEVQPQGKGGKGYHYSTQSTPSNTSSSSDKNNNPNTYSQSHSPKTVIDAPISSSSS